MLFGEEHVRLYEETGGRIGHDWEAGAPVLILTTTGRTSGQERKTPVIYHRGEGGSYLVVASQGGAPAHPQWYLNLVANPLVTLQVKDEKFLARARTATDEEKASWWPQLTKVWPRYDIYLTKTTRNIPVVILTRVKPDGGTAGHRSAPEQPCCASR